MKKAAAIFSFVMLAATPALAEEGAAKAGLPQLDPSLFLEQLFWLAVSFTVLYLLMHFVALPGVQKVQERREEVIDHELATAKAANEQAKVMATDAERALADARAKANAAITDIKTEASKQAAEQQAAQSKQLGQKLRDAEANIAAARDKALKEIEGVASDLSNAIVDNVSGLKVKA